MSEPPRVHSCDKVVSILRQGTVGDTEINFFVDYIVPADVWYVVPVNQIAPFQCLSFYPYGCRIGGFFESYREAWHLMAPGADLIPQPQTLRRVRAIDLHRKLFVE